MTRKTLAELTAGQPGLPVLEGMIDAVLRAEDGSIIQHVHQHNLITEFFRLLYAPNGDFQHHIQSVFIHENSEPMHRKRTAMRTTMPGEFAQQTTPTLDGPSRIWTYQTVFAAPATQRTIRTIGLCRAASGSGFTGLRVGVAGITAATLLSSPIVQTTSSTLEVSYRIAIQRN